MNPVFGFVSRHRVSLIALAVVVAASSLSVGSREAPSLAAYVWAICATNLRSRPPAEGPFISENVDAMTKMMASMEISPSGDVDRDFVAMMVPHHQGAIRMAQALLRYGHNERLRRMAQEIIVTQQQEIAAMRLALDETLPPSDAAPDQLSEVPQ
jgi:hypothetical protein